MTTATRVPRKLWRTIDPKDLLVCPNGFKDKPDWGGQGGPSGAAKNALWANSQDILKDCKTVRTAITVETYLKRGGSGPILGNQIRAGAVRHVR